MPALLVPDEVETESDSTRQDTLRFVMIHIYKYITIDLDLQDMVLKSDLESCPCSAMYLFPR